MNYLTEIRLFYDWLETHQLSPSSIALWHGLMYIANRAGWEESLCIPISRIENRTQLSRTSIYRERQRLQEAGLLRYIERGGRLSSVYHLQSFETRFVCQSGTQADTQPTNAENFVSQDMSQIGTQSGTQVGTIYKLNETKQRDNIFTSLEEPQGDIASKGKREKSSAQKEKKRKPNFNATSWLESLEEPWKEIMMLWFDYKVSRREEYKTELGARKCLSLIRRLSSNNAGTAQKIIDQSMANNWAGIFALRDGLARGHPPDGRQYGQRIGQIIQSDDDQKRQRYIDKLKNAGKK